MRILGAVARATTAVAQAVIAAACLVWVIWWLLSPDKLPDAWLRHYFRHSHSLFFGTYGRDGSAFFFQTLPWAVAAVLSLVVIELRPWSRENVEQAQQQLQKNEKGNDSTEEELEVCRRRVELELAYSSNDGKGDGGRSDDVPAKTNGAGEKNKIENRAAERTISGGERKSIRRRRRPWHMTWLTTCPVWVGKTRWMGGGGVVTAAELAGVLGVGLLVVYHISRLAAAESVTKASAWKENLGTMAYILGHASNLPFSLLWIPVTRGSPLLDLSGIPFERAVRYHIWLAISTIALLSLHSLCFILYFCIHTTQTVMTILRWDRRRDECAILAGVVAWAMALVMFVSSLSYFRRHFYDKFYILHHLYIPFFLFWLYHVVWSHHFFIIPVLLFFFDRFLRMLQSSRLVYALSAKLLPCGALELTLPLPSRRNDKAINGNDCSYNALSIWCINIPSISKYEWHFFSGASSPLDKTQTVSIIIKPLGDWTNKFLRHQFLEFGHISKKALINCPFSIKARVEGPYGDKSNFYIKYKTLILVAGGIGITPILAVLRDILHQHQYRHMRHTSTPLPTSIVVYHCIRNPKELCLLNTIDPHKIFPNYGILGLDIHVRVYITSKDVGDYKELCDQSGNSLDINVNIGQGMDLSKVRMSNHRSMTLALQCPSQGSHYGTISRMRTFGSTTWLTFCATLASLVGYFVLMGLANVYIVKSNAFSFYNYNQAHLIVACMILGIVAFGGSATLGWHLRMKHRTDLEARAKRCERSNGEPIIDEEEKVGIEGASPWAGDVHWSNKPNWKDVFEGLTESYYGESIGVLVSGSVKLQEDVARECKRNSSLGLNMSTVFEYHSLSFEF